MSERMTKNDYWYVLSMLLYFMIFIISSIMEDNYYMLIFATGIYLGAIMRFKR